MTKKSHSRLMRDAQNPKQKKTKPGKVPNSPGTWTEVAEQNIGIARILHSTASIVKQHAADPELLKHSPNPAAYINAFNAAGKNFNELSTRLIAIKEKIGERVTPIVEVAEAMDFMEIGVAHGEILTEMDNVYRPNLAILQEQVNIARNMRSAALSTVSDITGVEVSETPVASEEVVATASVTETTN